MDRRGRASQRQRDWPANVVVYCVIALALIDGDVSPETFNRTRFLDKDVLDSMGRMEIVNDPEFSKQTPAIRNCPIVATANSGETAQAHGSLTAGQIEAGMSDDRVEAKFLRPDP